MTKRWKTLQNNIMYSEEDIIKVCDEIKAFLVDKNRKYGDSALNPIRIFSTASTIEQLNVRLDDKLSRIVRGKGKEDEDVEKDMIGYLVLKQIAKRKEKEVGWVDKKKKAEDELEEEKESEEETEEGIEDEAEEYTEDEEEGNSDDEG